MKVVHSNEVPWADSLNRGVFQQRRKGLGGEKLSAGLWELPPGKTSFPLHRHLVTEEALYVLSGRAQVRTGDGVHDIGPGDFVSFPAGGPAHQLVNPGPEPLVYLGLSAFCGGADVVEYPDSGKLAVRTTVPESRRFVFRTADQRDYFDGEPGA